MAIYALGDRTPTIDPTAYVHPDAVVIGDVRIGAHSSVWPMAVLRGDYGTITLGAETNIQDGSIIHATPILPTTMGDRVVIGHMVHLEGCVIESDTLIGSGSVVLHHCVVRSGGQVAAGAVLRPNTEVPSGGLAVGIPATIKEGKAQPEAIAQAVAVYKMNGARYPAELKRLD